MAGHIVLVGRILRRPQDEAAGQAGSPFWFATLVGGGVGQIAVVSV